MKLWFIENYNRYLQRLTICWSYFTYYLESMFYEIIRGYYGFSKKDI